MYMLFKSIDSVYCVERACRCFECSVSEYCSIWELLRDSIVFQYFAEALSQVTHLHVYPGMTAALQPQFHTTEQQSVRRGLVPGAE